MPHLYNSYIMVQKVTTLCQALYVDWMCTYICVYTILQWRKFNFFDVTANVDGGRVSEALKVTAVLC